MSYKLKFLPSALKEWKKPDNSIQNQFKKILSKRLAFPHVPASRLSGFENHYKIKLQKSGYRLVYEVVDNAFFILLLPICFPAMIPKKRWVILKRNSILL